MDCLESTDIVLDQIKILDRYDGIVIATAIQQQKTYLILLAAWDLAGARKAFVLLDIQRSVEVEINFCVGEKNWNRFKEILDGVLFGYNVDAYLTFDEPTVGKCVSFSRISPKELASLRNYDFESALTFESLTQWFRSELIRKHSDSCFAVVPNSGNGSTPPE